MTPQQASNAPVPAPAPAPAPPAAAPQAVAGAPAYGGAGYRVQAAGGSATQVYQGALNQRRELRRTREGLEGERRQLSRDLQNPMVDGANKAGLEARIQLIDSRIIELDLQIAKADALVANAAGMPGAIQPERPERMADPEFAAPLTALFIVVVLMPLAVAHARRVWKRAGQAVSAVPQALLDRFGRLETNVDAMAIEMERVSEGQRFLTKLLAEREKQPVLERVE